MIDHRGPQMNGWVTAAIVITVVGGIMYAIANPPKQDLCTTNLIQRYTATIIDYKDCRAMTDCTITLRDVSDFNRAQNYFNECVALAAGENE